MGDVCSPWVEVEDLLESCSSRVTEALDEVDPSDLAESILAASEVLYELSGRRYPGTCYDTVRPCPRRPGVEADGWIEPAGYNSSWGWWRSPSQWCGCSEGPQCGGCCSLPSQIRLGGAPIIGDSVTVTIDGVDLPSTSWQILDHRWLVRVDGERWPCCQDFTSLEGEVGTWSVSYAFGRNPPASGRRAAIVLARELALSCVGSALCALPARVSTVTRQQTTLAVLDPQEFLGKGLTGLGAVDMFLAAERYGRAHRPAVFVNPDRSRFVRRVTDAPGS